MSHRPAESETYPAMEPEEDELRVRTGRPSTKETALIAVLLGGLAPMDGAAQEQEARLAAFKTFVEEHRRDNQVLSLSYAIVMGARQHRAFDPVG